MVRSRPPFNWRRKVGRGVPCALAYLRAPAGLLHGSRWAEAVAITRSSLPQNTNVALVGRAVPVSVGQAERHVRTLLARWRRYAFAISPALQFLSMRRSPALAEAGSLARRKKAQLRERKRNKRRVESARWRGPKALGPLYPPRDSPEDGDPRFGHNSNGQHDHRPPRCPDPVKSYGRHIGFDVPFQAACISLTCQLLNAKVGRTLCSGLRRKDFITATS